MAGKKSTTATQVVPFRWPSEQIERRLIQNLKAFERNARVHSEEQVSQVMASIREWGWTVPVLVDETDTIIAGHCRVEAARRLGADSVPVILATGWSDTQKRAYVLADNQLTLNSSWDPELLKIEITGLGELGFDLGLAGFSEMNIDQILAPDFDMDEAWGGMPSYENEDQSGFRDLMIHFQDQAAVDEFKKLIGQDFSDKAKFIWHPRVEREKLTDKAYAVSDLHPEQGSLGIQANGQSASETSA